MQVFKGIALLGIAGSFSRLFFGVIFVAMGFGATGALVGNAIGSVVMLLLSMMLVHRMIPHVSVKYVRPEGFYRYAFSFAIAMVGFGLLTSSDVVLVKRFFMPDVAGNYALAAMVARIVFFLPLPIASAMFPKVVSDGEHTCDARKTFKKALLLTLFCFLLPAAILEFRTEFFVIMMTGESSDVVVGLVRLLVFVYMPLPLLALILNYKLAQAKALVVSVPMLLFSVIYILFAKILDGGVERVAVSMGIAGYACLIWFGIREIHFNRSSRSLSVNC